MTVTGAKFSLLVCMSTCAYGQLTSAQIEEHAEKAQTAQAAQDFKTAIAEYGILSRAVPHNAELLSNLGVAYYFDGQLPRSMSTMRKAVAIKPDLEAPHLFLGLASYRLSDPDGAVKELQQTVHLNPDDALAHTWLGYAYMAQSHFDAALKEFQTTAQLQPDNVDGWYAMGQAYLEIGKEKTQQLLRIAPDGGRAWQLAGEQFAINGDKEKAAAAFAEAHRRRIDIPSSGAVGEAVTEHSSAEDLLYHQAHQAEVAAHEAFQDVLDQKPTSARAHQIMADAYFAQQQFDGALAEYRRVLEADPALPGIHLQISNCLMIQGQFAQALEESRAEEKLQPASARVQTDTGRILTAMGNDTEASTALKRALNLDRPPLETYLLLAKLDLRDRREIEAIPLLKHYVAVRPQDAIGYYLLSRAYRVTSDRDQMDHALALYKKTSQEAKERSMAQTELSRLVNQDITAHFKELEDTKIDSSVMQP